MKKNAAMQTGLSQIRQLNEALLVMKHFVELSAHLLPYLERITRKKKLSKKEKMDKDFVFDVYDNYEVDAATSRILLDSDIIQLILKSYSSLRDRNKDNELEAAYNLNKFYKEYHRLLQNWNRVEMN